MPLLQLLTDLRRKLDLLHARKVLHASELARAESDVLLHSKALEDAQEAQQRLQELASRTQQAAHEGLAGVATRSLKAVFGKEAYSFRIDFEQKRGRTEAKLILADSRGRDIGDPLESTGHGYVDVGAFALRLAAMILRRPPVRRLFVADEPFRAVDRKRRPAVRKLIEALAGELGVQIVLVTHDPELVCGDVIDLEEE